MGLVLFSDDAYWSIVAQPTQFKEKSKSCKNPHAWRLPRWQSSVQFRTRPRRTIAESGKFQALIDSEKARYRKIITEKNISETE